MNALSSRICISAIATVAAFSIPAASWPGVAYPEIFIAARQTMPEPLEQLLLDMEPLLYQACTPTSIDEAVERAISRFSEAGGDIRSAVAAMRDAGCAIAEMNDPDMDALVTSQQSRFPVVFYGWHPSIQERDLQTYIEMRQSEVADLEARFHRSSELPNRSEMVELSPEFGLASVAYSHAVTDVANVWLYIWMSVNGSF